MNSTDPYGTCPCCSAAIEISGLGHSLCSDCEWVATRYVIFTSDAELQPKERKPRQLRPDTTVLSDRRPVQNRKRGKTKQAKAGQPQLALGINGGSN